MPQPISAATILPGNNADRQIGPQVPEIGKKPGFSKKPGF